MDFTKIALPSKKKQKTDHNSSKDSFIAKVIIDLYYSLYLSYIHLNIYIYLNMYMTPAAV